MSKFESRISAYGQEGNVFCVLGTATNFMRQLKCEKSDIEALRNQVMSAQNYDEAIGFIEQWFPVDRD